MAVTIRKIMFLLMLSAMALCQDRSHTITGVPYYRQITDYACGAASLQMVLDYYSSNASENVQQETVMDVARTSESDGTMTPDITRAGRFSAMSSANGIAFPSFTVAGGFPGRPIGLAAFEHLDSSPWMDDLKDLIDRDLPIIVLSKYSLDDNGGHYRVVIGYDDDFGKIYLQDPWGRSPDARQVVDFTYTDWITLWNYTEVGRSNPFFGTLLVPWNIECLPTFPSTSEFVVTCEIEYPCYEPFDCSQSQLTASHTIASIQFPVDLVALDDGQSSSAYLGAVSPSSVHKTQWKFHHISSTEEQKGNIDITVSATGVIRGSVDKAPCCVKNGQSITYPPYDYVDAIGGKIVLHL